MEANHRFWVNADNVQTPAVALEKTGKQPQENSTNLFILQKYQISQVHIQVCTYTRKDT